MTNISTTGHDRRVMARAALTFGLSRVCLSPPPPPPPPFLIEFQEVDLLPSKTEEDRIDGAAIKLPKCLGEGDVAGVAKPWD
jgi:hypothetical protein